MYSGRYCFSLVTFTFAAAGLACAAQPLTYSQVVERFHANNPQLLAGVVGIDESRANEVTAGLRPNPDFSFTNDQFQWFHGNPYRPLSSAEFIMSVSQLFERRQKRRLRVQSAEEATAMAKTDQADLERTLLFTLRGAFVSLLQAKSLLELAQDNLAYYDKVISVNRDRFNAGDIAKIDFARVELQRVQFESDFENANVNLRTTKIQLLALMDERTPIDQFDVSGEFDYKDDVLVAEELRKIALAARPDLLSASTAIEKARVDNRLAWANGSTDPTIGISYVNNGQPGGQGYNVSIPLRLFDKNQGELQHEMQKQQKAKGEPNQLA